MLYITSISKLTNLSEVVLTEEDQAVIFSKETDSVKVTEANQLLSMQGKVEFYPVAGKEDMLICLGMLIANEEKCFLLDDTIPVPKRLEEKIEKLTVKKQASAKPRKKRARKNGQAAENTDEKPVPSETGSPQEADPVMENNSANTDGAPTETEKETVSQESDERKSSVGFINIGTTDNGPAEEKKDPSFPMPSPETGTNTMAEDTAAQDKPSRSRRSPSKKTSDKKAEPVFDEGSENEKRLYELLGIRSEDISFSWPTEMLMTKILGILEEDKDHPEDIKNGILTIRNGGKIWSKLEPVLEEAKKLV